MAKIAAKKNVPWRHNYGDADDNTLVFMWKINEHHLSNGDRMNKNMDAHLSLGLSSLSLDII